MTALVTVAACSAVLAVGMRMMCRKQDVNYVVARVFLAVAGTALGIKVEVEGEEHLLLGRRPVVIMMNHQSMLDVLIVGRLMPKQTTIMAKESLRYTPLGPFMTLAGAIFVDRANNKRAVQSLVAAGDKMKARQMSLWMFPEGTRTLKPEPDMLPLKKGGFHLALQAEAAIIPVIAENYWWIYHKGIFGTGTIKVRVLPPVSTEGYTVKDIPKLATIIRDQMVRVLKDISYSHEGCQVGKSKEIKRPEEDQVEPSGAVPVMNDAAGQFLDKNLSSGSLALSEHGLDTDSEEGMVVVKHP